MRSVLPLLLALSLAACVGSSPDDGDVRVIHASVDTDSLDMLIANRVVFQSLVYGDVTGYESVEAEEQEVDVRSSTDRSDAPLRFVANLIPERPQTLIIAGVRARIAPIALRDSLFTGTASAHVRIVHAASLADSVDVTFAPAGSLPAAPTFAAVQYRQNTGYLASSPGTYHLQVRPAGAPGLLFDEDVEVSTGAGLTLVLTDRTPAGGIGLITTRDTPPATVQ